MLFMKWFQDFTKQFMKTVKMVIFYGEFITFKLKRIYE